MSYKFEKKNSPNQSSRESYGYKEWDGITIHHWGSYGQDHDVVVDYLMRKGGNSSAHLVVSGGRCTQLVPYNRAAWHSGNREGNGRTIGIEMRPEMSKDDWDTLVEVCADIEEAFGSKKYYKHSQWKATACPGKYSDQIGKLIDDINTELKRRKSPVKPQTKPSTYTVKKGDNLTKIAKANGTTISKLMKLNDIRDSNKIGVGQKLKLR